MGKKFQINPNSYNVRTGNSRHMRYVDVLVFGE